MVHSDWEEERQYAPSYIKNKPLLLTSGGATQQAADWEATGGPTQILNKPTIPAAQVYADWNATQGAGQILNKPTIPAPQQPANFNASSGPTQILNQPPIPVQSDWLATGGLAQILNKPVIPDSQSPVDWGATSGYTRIINKPTILAGQFKLTEGKATVTFGTSFKNPPAVTVTLAEPVDNADVYSFNASLILLDVSAPIDHNSLHNDSRANDAPIVNCWLPSATVSLKSSTHFDRSLSS